MDLLKCCIAKLVEWCDDNFDGLLEWFLIVIGVILFIGIALGIVFGIYCIIGYALYYVYNHIALELSLPQFNYWFFVAGAYIISWIIKTFRRQPTATATTTNKDND